MPTLAHTANAVVSHELYACDLWKPGTLPGRLFGAGGDFLYGGGEGVAGGAAGALGAGEEAPAEVGLRRGPYSLARRTSAAFRAASMAVMASTGGAMRYARGSPSRMPASWDRKEPVRLTV